MVDHSLLTPGLRQLLLEVTRGQPSRESVHRLVGICHALASAALGRKASAGTLIRVHGLGVSDLAYDCIAELFRQDEEGRYLQFESFFSSVSFDESSPEELLAHLRRLVFSKVNHGVFRLCAESDPALAKILRNVKLAVQSLAHFRETERLGEQCIVPAGCDALDHRAPFTREELETLFFEVVAGDERIPEMTAKFARALREQEERCRAVPLMAVGFLIRAAYERKALPARQHEAPAADPFAVNDLVRCVQEACRSVEAETRRKYVERGKVSEETFRLYFTTIEEELCARFGSADGDGASLYEILSRKMPGMSRPSYAAEHRNQIEYLLRLVKQRTALLLRGS